ncbi:sulfur carrier protein ThiS [Methylobacterium oryzisoli]|uniref:sulfur carrier protein ThiS n=1 Tax=Methylobacterium oryzisoli TaxID=3385502 RepID=UPI003891B325
MRLTVNGEPRDCEAETLDALWRQETADLDLPGPQGFAIALNGAVVRRGDWAQTRLAEGDRVEIVRAMQGG